MTETAPFRIEATPKPSESHWEHMRDPAEHLADELAQMQTALSVGDNDDEPYGFLESWALEARTATWNGGVDVIGVGKVARAVVVLGTGGPHVELDFSYDHHGRCERVELRRYWSQADSATTTDTRALAIVDDFTAAFLVVE